MTIETLYIRSGTAISETIVVALNSEMKRLSAFRQHAAHDLRQRDAPQDQRLRHAERASCIDVALGNGLDAGAEGLGEIAAVHEAERDDGG